MSDTITTKTVTWGHGRNVLWAGTPVDTNGVPCNTGSAIGVVYEDLHMPDRSLKVLTAGTWDETLPEHQKSGIIISDAAKMAMDDITFAVPPVPTNAEIAEMLGGYVQKTDLATIQAAGIVKQSKSVANATGSPTKTNFNDLVTKLKDAGIIVPDSFNVSVLACPNSGSMPTAETTANSGHATVTLEGNEITIALNCAVSELADANHGETWGTHKWLGFGVRTGLASIVGVKFTDDTGASATLASSDASEATALGLSAGDFVLYIKAEQEEYLSGEKYFILENAGYAPVQISMKITEPATT